MFEMYRGGEFVDDHVLLKGERGPQAQLRLVNRYQRLLRRGQLRALWSRLTRRSYQLRALPGTHHAAGKASTERLRSVPIAQIVGSENRSADFDNKFAPLQEHTIVRWLGVAAAWEMGAALPAVELIQVGNDYYVRDGHHRISVARSYGQDEIDAHVLVWQPAPQPGSALELCAAC